ncbi:YbhB/YbcL family Raf kinase inhibitor-like protein [Streptomyces sp. NPDC048291]|uniref:YbhB/YbcL family Raf kinase inhibitor-like protein n=1 Tax=Streptomyces sp. NPDC048291 TaxID=3365530 RepID=UPI00371677F5
MRHEPVRVVPVARVPRAGSDRVDGALRVDDRVAACPLCSSSSPGGWGARGHVRHGTPRRCRAWGALPDGTKSLVFVLEDLDVPTSTPGIHTIAAFPAVEAGIPEGAVTPDDPRFQFLRNRRGQAKYAGPRPLPGHGTHRYRFHLYALDADIDFTKAADMHAVPAALAGHVLASGTLTGTRTT